MESKYIDLVINRLTQAQYDELKRTNQISEEELYEIIDHDDLFYYKKDTYSSAKIDELLANLNTTIRSAFGQADANLTSAINSNTALVNDLRNDLVSNVSTLEGKITSTTNSLNSYKTTVSNTYATKKELSEYSPVSANPSLSGSETILDSIEIDGLNYKVYPEGEVEFNDTLSNDSKAIFLGSIKVGDDIWNIPSGKPDLSDYYTKNEVDDRIAGAISGGELNLSNYYTKGEVDEMLTEIDVSDQLVDYAKAADVYTKTQIDNKGFLTQHQSLAGYATESYVNTKVAALVDSSPGALDTLKELATALGNDPNFATTITTEIGKKANSSDVYTKSEVDNAISNVNVSNQLQNYYTKSEIDSKDFTNVSANPELTGSEVPLTSVSIKGVNYIVSSGGGSGEGEHSLILSDTPIEGADNLASITINGDSWNIVGSGGGGIDPEVFEEALQNYYTKSEVNSAISTEVSKVVGAAPDAYNTLKEIADYIESDLDAGAALEASIAKKANSTDVYTKSEANAKYALKTDIPAPTDLTNYYTKNETLEVIDKISGLDNYYDSGTIDTKFETVNANKQDKLVSGENIKTINGVSIMGVGNILINEGSSGGTPVEANPALDGTEQDLTAISINNVNYAIPAGDMLFSEEVVQGEKTLKTVVIDGDTWSIEKGSTLIANVPLTGDEDPLESVQIDDTVFTLKGEEMLFYENELEGAVPLKTIVINGDPWYVGGLSEDKVDAKINTRINALVNSAPNTLDTLGELAEALQENSSVVETLNSAISNKADKTEIIKSYNNLTDKPTIPNIVFGETEPTNPTQGMIWLKPL